jgi:hypothetical protein
MDRTGIYPCISAVERSRCISGRVRSPPIAAIRSGGLRGALVTLRLDLGLRLSMLRRARFALVLSALSIAACAERAAADLPGSATFPLVAGSAIAPCPADWGADQIGEAVCVSAPIGDRGETIVDAYKRILDERGFRFGRYLDSPSVVMLTRRAGNECEVMIFGLPYLPPEQRTRLLLVFALNQASVEDCAQIEREGQR